MDKSAIPKQRFTDARLKKPPAERFKKYITASSLEVELEELFYCMCQVNLAHIVMLAEEKIIPKADAAKILVGQREIEKLGPEKFPVNPEYGGLYLQFESYLTDKLGEDVAGKAHTGRSRSDLHSTISRLYTRDKLLFVVENLIKFQKSLLDLAQKHVDTIMPGHTHMQQAQPWTLGHHLTGIFYMFGRDFDRFTLAYDHTDLNPLGGCVVSGTSWPLNPKRTTELLGFDKILVNARDASIYAGCEFLMEATGANAILMNNLGRFAGDLNLWNSQEFGLIELADEYCGTSSIMPQKKNPYPLENTRALSGQAIGWMAGIMGILKTATTMDCDYPRIDMALCGMPEVAKNTANTLDLMAGVLDTLIVHEEPMKRSAGAFWGTATALADAIVRETGLSFRSAHHIVGRTVRLASEAGTSPSEVTGELVDKAAKEVMNRTIGLSTNTVQDALDPVNFINGLVTLGSSNPKEVAKMVEDCRDKLKKEQDWLEQKKAKLSSAREKLSKAVDAVISP